MTSCQNMEPPHSTSPRISSVQTARPRSCRPRYGSRALASHDGRRETSTQAARPGSNPTREAIVALAPATGRTKVPHSVEHSCYLTPAMDRPCQEGHDVWVCQPTTGVRTSKPRGWRPCWRVEEKVRASRATAGLSHWQNNVATSLLRAQRLRAKLTDREEYTTRTEAQEETR